MKKVIFCLGLLFTLLLGSIPASAMSPIENSIEPRLSNVFIHSIQSPLGGLEIVNGATVAQRTHGGSFIEITVRHIGGAGMGPRATIAGANVTPVRTVTNAFGGVDMIYNVVNHTGPNTFNRFEFFNFLNLNQFSREFWFFT